MKVLLDLQTHYFLLEMYIILCITVFSISVFGNELKNITNKDLLKDFKDATDKKLEFLELCQSFNLKTLSYANSKMNTITVSFEPANPKFKDCFAYFYIFLVRSTHIVEKYRVRNIFSEDEAISHTFENVECGIYEVVIQPCFSDWECSILIIKDDKLINMSSIDCISKPQSLSGDSVSALHIEKEKIIFLVVVSLVLIVAGSGLAYKYCISRSGLNGPESTDNSLDAVERADKILLKNIQVYILHYYDKNNVMKRKVKALKDFLWNSSHFNSVKVIEDDLAEILFNVNGWLNHMIEKSKDGCVKRIILIDSEEYKSEEHELENLIYSRFIENMNNNLYKCCTDYDNLFVVQFDDIISFSDKIRNVVRRHRYRIPQHTDILYQNLCVVSDQ